MKGTLRLRLLGTFCLFAASVVFADRVDEIENSAQNILQPAQVAAAVAQLYADNKHLVGIEDTRFVPAVVNCSSVISDSVDTWKEKYRIASKKQEVKGSRVYVEIEMLEPVHGSLFVIYRFLSADKKAYLKILFDSNVVIDSTQKEIIGAKYRLVELKRTLVENMKCD